MLLRVLERLPWTRSHTRRTRADRAFDLLGEALRLPPTDPVIRRATLNRILLAHYGTALPMTVEERLHAWVHLIATHSYLRGDRSKLGDALARTAGRLVHPTSMGGEQALEELGHQLAYDHRLTTQAFQDALELIIPAICDAAADHRGPASAIAALAGGFAAGTRARTLDEQVSLAEAVTTIRTKDQHSLLTNPRQFTQLMAASRRPMGVLTRDGVFLHTNLAMRELLAWDGTGNRMLEDFTYTDADCLAVRAMIANVTETGSVHEEFGIAWPEGAFKAWVAAGIAWHPATNTRRGQLHLLLDDATVHRGWRRHLAHAAEHDKATDLPNRRRFLARTRAILANTADDCTVGLCAIRLDDLTSITRELGPIFGDQVVTTIANRITGAISATVGTSIARLDRATFAVLLTDTESWIGVSDMVKRVVEWISAPLRIRQYELCITPRVGVAEAPAGTTDATDLLHRAEMALDTPTTTRRPWTIIDDRSRPPHADRDRRLRRNHLLAGLPAAFDRGELTVVYTPIARVADGATVGAQAHIQWRHSTYGDILVDELVDLADDIGLTLPLARWTLHQATAQAARWRTQVGDAAPFVHIPLPRRLADEEILVQHVRDALTTTQLPADLLYLAVPEAAVIDNAGRPRDHLIMLDQLGVRIMLDGLGTSYRRYDRLATIPLHGVVIDTEAASSPATAQSRQQLTQFLIALSTDLTYLTLVQGIDTPDQLHHARQARAHLAEGKHIGTPQPADQITDTLIPT